MAENTGKDVKIHGSGFRTNHLHPELGCSHDGLAYCNNNNLKRLIGVVEILNVHLFSLAVKDPLCVDELNANKRNNLCYNVMHFVKQTFKEYCQTVIFGKFLVQTINFHHNTLMPEYIEMRIPRQLMPVDLKI
ncbi:hypothetical protein ACJMK2_028573 [Sinanodonta woodiana]|uniref:Uncharacterized protein n=1 Tax=Sinanodonta woodiana TaxID=1069815 RepID=A0ABD3XBD0_SINWO